MLTGARAVPRPACQRWLSHRTVRSIRCWHRAARLTSIITTIEAEVAGAFSMPILSVLDDPMPLEITGGLLPGRCEAARSFKAAAEAAVAAQQRRGLGL